jgi:hypothetical protein
MYEVLQRIDMARSLDCPAVETQGKSIKIHESNRFFLLASRLSQARCLLQMNGFLGYPDLGPRLVSAVTDILNTFA